MGQSHVGRPSTLVIGCCLTTNKYCRCTWITIIMWIGTMYMQTAPFMLVFNGFIRGLTNNWIWWKTWSIFITYDESLLQVCYRQFFDDRGHRCDLFELELAVDVSNTMFRAFTLASVGVWSSNNPDGTIDIKAEHSHGNARLYLSIYNLTAGSNTK